MRFTVAVAAPVIMLVAPGPIEEVQTNVALRVPRLGESRGNVDGALLVAAEIVREVGVLLQGLPQAGDDAVPEDAPGAFEEAVFHAVALYVLVLEKAHQCLGHRNVTMYASVAPYFSMSIVTSGSRGSWSRQDCRTHSY